MLYLLLLFLCLNPFWSTSDKTEVHFIMVVASICQAQLGGGGKTDICLPSSMDVRIWNLDSLYGDFTSA